MIIFPDDWKNCYYEMDLFPERKMVLQTGRGACVVNVCPDQANALERSDAKRICV